MSDQKSLVKVHKTMLLKASDMLVAETFGKIILIESPKLSKFILKFRQPFSDKQQMTDTPQITVHDLLEKWSKKQGYGKHMFYTLLKGETKRKLS